MLGFMAFLSFENIKRDHHYRKFLIRLYIICFNFVNFSPYLDKIKDFLLKLGLEEYPKLHEELMHMMELQPFTQQMKKR